MLQPARDAVDQTRPNVSPGGLFRLQLGGDREQKLNEAASAVFSLLRRVAVSDDEWPCEDDVAGTAAWGLLVACSTASTPGSAQEGPANEMLVQTPALWSGPLKPDSDHAADLMPLPKGNRRGSRNRLISSSVKLSGGIFRPRARARRATISRTAARSMGNCVRRLFGRIQFHHLSKVRRS
jgi:hypothetical protein